jgi:anti-anti-sigma factor
MFTVNRLIKDSDLILSLEGVLDYSTISIFNQSIEKLTDISRVMIDFSNMEFIDSTGIGAILDFIYLGKERKFKVQLIGLQQDVKDLFETVGVFQILNALQGEEE